MEMIKREGKEKTKTEMRDQRTYLTICLNGGTSIRLDRSKGHLVIIEVISVMISTLILFYFNIFGIIDQIY